ncbi:MAG: ABC transporter ATP-binding protein [Propionibacteriaceae bacterium]|nr:ABC transporter ATP-binding protein [Propionibacteriaceae bacterium]
MITATFSQPLVAQLESVGKTYRNYDALTGVNLTLQAGEAVGLIGPNGAGKTTLLSLLSGQRRPTSGRVSLLGGDPRKPRTRTSLGVAPQALSLPETAKVNEVINYVSAFYQHPASCKALLSEFGLTHLARRQIGGLSGGQKRLLSVALAFAGSPALVLLDEPTTGLDAAARELLWDQVSARIDRGATVLVTSHYLEDINRLAERIVALDKGKIALDKPISEVRSLPSRATIRIQTTDPAKFDRVYHLEDPIHRHGVLTFITDDLDATVGEITEITGSLAGIEITNDALASAGGTTERSQ